MFVLPLSGQVVDVENKMSPTVWADGAKQKEAGGFWSSATYLPAAALLP